MYYNMVSISIKYYFYYILSMCNDSNVITNLKIKEELYYV